MVYYIIIRGPAGVGKSTIAKELSKQLNGFYVSYDNILKKNKLAKLDKKRTNPCIPSENFIKANEIILKNLKDILGNKIVIFDGCFYHYEQIEHLIKKLSYDYFIFTLKASLKDCIIKKTMCRHT
ncbi:MAG: AAA family ATPase [Nanoarchaeota archaeon]|nr:AAA family ATPase [Nanoarchaeota archaeon]